MIAGLVDHCVGIIISGLPKAVRPELVVPYDRERPRLPSRTKAHVADGNRHPGPKLDQFVPALRKHVAQTGGHCAGRVKYLEFVAVDAKMKPALPQAIEKPPHAKAEQHVRGVVGFRGLVGFGVGS